METENDTAMTPEQEKTVEKYGRLLKSILRNYRRIVYHFSPDSEDMTVDYEVHGKIKFNERKTK